MSVARHAGDIVAAVALLAMGSVGGYAVADMSKGISCELAFQYNSAPVSTWRRKSNEKLLPVDAPDLAAAAPAYTAMPAAVSQAASAQVLQSDQQTGHVFVRNGAATTDLKLRFQYYAGRRLLDERVETIRAGQEIYIDLPAGEIMAVAEPINTYGWPTPNRSARTRRETRLQLAPDQTPSLTFDDQTGLTLENS